jgi:DinB superfamily
MNEMVSRLEQISADAKQTFGGLAAAQINWKPAAEKWSVGQCFEHLIKINAAYFPVFAGIIKGGRKQTFWENYSPLSGFFGNWLFKNLSPQAEGKLKAPKAAQPSASDVAPTIIADFVKHQAELIDNLRQTETLDTKRIIITSPFIKAVTYSLWDTYRIIATHERRHFAQALRVLQTDGFPQ